MYIITIMGMTSISVCMAVIISHIHHQSVRSRRVPKWLHGVMKKMARVVFMEYNPIHINNNFQWPSTADTSPDSKTPLRDSYSSINLSFNGENDCRLADITSSILRSKETNDVSDSIRRKHHQRRPNKMCDEEIIQKLNLVLLRQEASMNNVGGVNRDWQHIAEIIDRVFFWIYLFTLFLITVIILLIMPNCRE